jgi:hypothetical protein
MEDQLLALDEGPEGHVDERREVRGWHSRALPPQTLARYPEAHDPNTIEIEDRRDVTQHRAGGISRPSWSGSG